MGLLSLIKPKLYLIHDEVEHVRVTPTNTSHAFRVRVWASKAAGFVVLASQVNDASSPRWHVRKIANYVHMGILHFTASPVRWYTDGMGLGRQTVQQHTFNMFGKLTDRQVLFDPTAEDRTWEQLEEVVGTRLER